MKALTIWPEWAWAICQIEKDVENRTWTPPSSVIGQRIAIHAGKNIGGRYNPPNAAANFGLVAEMAVHAGIELRPIYRLGVAIGFSWYRCENGNVKEMNQFFASLPTGGVVATAKISGWSKSSSSPWAVPGQVHWQLEEVQVLPQRIPCRGAQGLWPLPEDVESKILIAATCPPVPHVTDGNNDRDDGAMDGQLELF
jgi:hypothetical protein